MQIQKFGLELRKIGNVKNLYSDVDILLNRYNLKNGVNADLQIQSVAHSLQKMLNVKSHFSVCTIDLCSELCQLNIPKDRYLVYRNAHCMNWNEMTEDFRNMLVALVLDDFRSVLNAT